MTLDEFVAEQVYLVSKDIISRVVSKLSRKFNWDQEELQAEANYQFLVALKEYEKEKSKIEAWVYYFITKRLYDSIEKEFVRSKKRVRIYPEPSYETSSFLVSDLMEDLSEDAQYVVRLTLDMPDAVSRRVQRRGEETPRRVRGALREFLEGEGWTKSRVTMAYEEIEEAMKQ